MSADWLQDLNSRMPGGPVEADVCILGSGPVGLTLARALGNKGCRVVVLESGGVVAGAPADPQDVVFDRRVYRGASSGRAFGLGGTSTLWGGQLLPLRNEDFHSRPQIDAPAWPISLSDIEPYFGELQQWFGIDCKGFDLESLTDDGYALLDLNFADFAPRLTKWLKFGQRNIAHAWKRHLADCGMIQVWLNAGTQSWQFDMIAGLRSVTQLTAVSAMGHRLIIRPRTVVIAAGALESARTVLELNEQAGCLGAGVREFAGRFLHDHLSMRLGTIRMTDKDRFEDIFAPIFEDAIMRSLRLEMTPASLARDRLPAMYAHIVAQEPADSGFAVIRDCLRAVQRRNLRECLLFASRVPRTAPEIARLLLGRYVQHRMLFPTDCALFLHADFEQPPRRENRVYLGAIGPGGRRRLHIDWDLDPDIAVIARTIQRRFKEFWTSNGLDRVAHLEFLNPGDTSDHWTRNVYDIYHPAGTTRMSADPALGVVDHNLLIHGTNNIYVSGSAVFPSMGAANPTFTAMALSLRLADFIDQRHGDAQIDRVSPAAMQETLQRRSKVQRH